MKRLIPMLLAFLVLLSTGPYSRCICSPSTPNVSSVKQEHSCCNKQNVEACDSANLSFSKSKNCCGMNSGHMPVATNNFASETVQTQQVLIQFPINWSFDINKAANCKYQLGKANRAPPYLVGLGTSQTYLFKRTLLI